MEEKNRFIEYATMLGYTIEYDRSDPRPGCSHIHEVRLVHPEEPTALQVASAHGHAGLDIFYKEARKQITNHYRNVVCK